MEEVKQIVDDLLNKDYSPEQIDRQNEVKMNILCKP